jgi:hypothetical protein
MIVTDQQPQRVNVHVYGEFTLADYKEFEEAVNYKIRFEGPVDLYFDVREMVAVTLDVAWEELRFTRQHAGDFRRIAVVTDHRWVGWSAWLSMAFTAARLQVFEDPAAAEAWLASAAA